MVSDGQSVTVSEPPSDENPGGTRPHAGPDRTMLLVPIESVRAGNVLAQPVLDPTNDDLLLIREGITLTARTISRLQQHEVSHVWLSFPGLEEVGETVDPRIAQGHMELYRVLNGSIDELEKRVNVKMNVQRYRKAVHGMLASIVDNPEHAVLTNQLRMCGPRLAGHMANVSYLSLLIGAHLSGYLREQRPSLPSDVAENTAMLGLGALLHDIGKLNMPDDLRAACILDEQAAWGEYQLHTQAGYEEVHEHVSPVAANVVLHHHQRYDGRGFPAVNSGATQQGQKIHIFSRIVGAVDAFDHLLCPRGKPMPTIVALRQIKEPRFTGWFDPVVIEALVRLVPPFMIGSMVKLNDGADAVVIENHPEAPCKPSVKIIEPPVGNEGATAQPRTLDLRMCRDTRIQFADGVDISGFLYDGEFEPGAAA